VRCETFGVVTFEHDGTVYSVNGMADSLADEMGWSSIDSIWAEGPDGYGLKVHIGELIQIGLALPECVRQ
jgi:hypothetical protein